MRENLSSRNKVRFFVEVRLLVSAGNTCSCAGIFSYSVRMDGLQAEERRTLQ